MWGFVDLNGSSRGNAMYAFYAALRGKRFLGAYEDPKQSVVQQLATALEHPTGAIERETRRLLDACGGFRACMLELTVTALAVVRPLSQPTPPGLGDWRDLSQDLGYAWMHTRLIADQHPRRVDEALDDLVGLLGCGRGRLSELIHQEYARIGEAVFPELIPPARRPAACVVACALPFAVSDREDELLQFARRLPVPLLDGAVKYALRRFERQPATGPAIGSAAERFVHILMHAAHAQPG
jgi:hypothetical protein